MASDEDVKVRLARLEGRVEQWMLSVERRLNVSGKTLAALLSLLASAAIGLIVGLLQRGGAG